MTVLKLNSLGKLGLVSVAAITALSLGACSTTSGMVAQGAPITYKVDQGQTQQASIYVPNITRTAPSAPAARMNPVPALPAPLVQSQPLAPVMPPALAFDQSKVDTDLYAHQRIGKKYTIKGKSYTPKHQPFYNVVGTASWYGDKFHGRLTANGETYDMNGFTAAHKTLPLNSMVYVTNVETGKGLSVRINDRGPFVGSRIIDLSRATAQELGLFTSGLAKVRVQYAGPADPNASKKGTRPKMVPTPRPRPEPDLVAEVPNGYTPLRDMGTTPPAPVAATPQMPSVNPLLGLGTQEPYAAPQTPEGDAPVTLTIKGPIHMAGSNNDDSQSQAKFIPAVNYTQIPAGK